MPGADVPWRVDRFHHAPLHRALLDRLRRERFAGATIIDGMAGFGVNSVIHTASELSIDLPVLIAVVDDQAHTDRRLPTLDEMLTGGALLTVERMGVVKYAAGANRERS